MSAQQNGHASQGRNASTMRSTATQKESGITDKQAHERLMFLLTAAIVTMSRRPQGLRYQLTPH